MSQCICVSGNGSMDNGTYSSLAQCSEWLGIAALGVAPEDLAHGGSILTQVWAQLCLGHNKEPEA